MLGVFVGSSSLTQLQASVQKIRQGSEAAETTPFITEGCKAQLYDLQS
jgi:hypothetical protein